MALAAAADPGRYAGVGVDIERAAPRALGFLETAFSAAERSAIAALGEGPVRDQMITRLWCAREALGKAFGLGIADILDRFEAVPAHRGGAPAQMAGTDQEAEIMFLSDRSTGAIHPVRLLDSVRNPALPPGMIGAVALRSLQ
jgi:phosphopantetheinyl transferase